VSDPRSGKLESLDLLAQSMSVLITSGGDRGTRCLRLAMWGSQNRYSSISMIRHALKNTLNEINRASLQMTVSDTAPSWTQRPRAICRAILHGQRSWFEVLMGLGLETS